MCYMLNCKNFNCSDNSLSQNGKEVLTIHYCGCEIRNEVTIWNKSLQSLIPSVQCSLRLILTNFIPTWNMSNSGRVTMNRKNDMHRSFADGLCSLVEYRNNEDEIPFGWFCNNFFAAWKKWKKKKSAATGNNFIPGYLRMNLRCLRLVQIFK